LVPLSGSEYHLVDASTNVENVSPWQIIERLTLRSPLELCLLPPVLLDYYLADSGDTFVILVFILPTNFIASMLDVGRR